jgi:hypothetical protein
MDSPAAESLERHYQVNTIAPALLISEVARRTGRERRCAWSTFPPTPPARFPGASTIHQARWITGQAVQVAGGHAL